MFTTYLASRTILAFLRSSIEYGDWRDLTVVVLARVYLLGSRGYTAFRVSSHFAFRIRKARSSLDGDESYMKMMNEYITPCQTYGLLLGRWVGFDDGAEFGFIMLMQQIDDLGLNVYSSVQVLYKTGSQAIRSKPSAFIRV